MWKSWWFLVLHEDRSTSEENENIPCIDPSLHYPDAFSFVNPQ